MNDAGSSDFSMLPRLPSEHAGAALLYRGPHARSPNTPRLLLVHGAYHGAWCYGAWMQAFATRGLECAAVDLRGHGSLRNGGLSPQTTVADYAADVCAAAGAFGPRPVLVGHSLGGLVVALAAARIEPHALILVAPSPPGNCPGARAIPLVPTDTVRMPPGLDEIAGRFLDHDPTVDVHDYAERLGPESPAALNDRYGLTVAVDPSAVRCPVLVIEAGRDDPLRHPPGQDEAIARFFGGEHMLVDDAPHCMMVGRSADATASLVSAWLARLG